MPKTVFPLFSLFLLFARFPLSLLFPFRHPAARRTALFTMLFAWFAITALVFAHPAAAQGGAICVITFNDANGNGLRDTGEETLENINVNLMVDSNLVVANRVTQAGEPYCFNNLPAQDYTLSFDSPLYKAVDDTPVRVALEAGGRVTREFGAVRKAERAEVAPSDTILNIPLTMPVRLGMSLAAALIVMAVFSGVGLAIYGLFMHRRPLREPVWVEPPTTTTSAGVAAQRLRTGEVRKAESAPAATAQPVDEDDDLPDLPRSERYDDDYE